MALLTPRLLSFAFSSRMLLLVFFCLAHYYASFHENPEDCKIVKLAIGDFHWNSWSKLHDFFEIFLWPDGLNRAHLAWFWKIPFPLHKLSVQVVYNRCNWWHHKSHGFTWPVAGSWGWMRKMLCLLSSKISRNLLNNYFNNVFVMQKNLQLFQ